ncbi:MAG: hypothetical protein ABI667_06685, partial [Sphingomicrobium sp.]
AAGDSVRTAKTCAFGPDDRDVITAILQERGAPGDAIFFANVLTDGTPDYRTSHCARPPTRGEKWVLSQWIRAKPFPFGQPPQP